ncbi:MAG TPA: SIS domain-containing protein [Candidatus Nitrosotenuis sp.]|nr:SIS domain-containing protein [Candidatus Nitrosotenuis sp.]
MCGITGLVYDARQETRLDWDRLRCALQALEDEPVEPRRPAAFDPLLAELERLAPALREYSVSETLRARPDLRDLLAQGARRLEAWEARVGELGSLPTETLEAWNALAVRCRDLAWLFSRDVLGSLERLEGLLPPEFAGLGKARFEAWRLGAVLENIGRLEVRGRDSLGLSSLVFFSGGAAFQEFLQEIREHPDWQRRRALADFVHGAILTDPERFCLVFTFKVAEEVGALGDNVARLREALRQDAIFWRAAAHPATGANHFSHTRWASNGIISEANCHPVNQETEGAAASSYHIMAALNGDVDNYQELVAHLAAETGRRLPPAITTDAKIIPVMIDHYYRQTGDLRRAFCRAMQDFEGSLAVVMHSTLEPRRTYLALRGSGQSMFVGLCPHGYAYASELYGVVEQTPRFLRMDGLAERVPGRPETAGQIFILEEGAQGVEAIEAWSFDGERLVLPADAVRTAEITTRDINRGPFEHFLLKEISESPQSVAKTLRGKYFLPRDGEGEVAFNLGPEVFPPVLAERLTRGQIRRLFLIGQGTAAVAGAAVATMMERALAGSQVSVRARKATELSGYALEDDMSDCLVVAISQSGTTTDTNRTVDLVRARGALVLGIVNRRNSDLVYKVDGVLYTSDGRDIEMSVASTKAFYSQVVAGYLLGLYMASLLGTMDPRDLRRELEELERLPGKMAMVLAQRDRVQGLAERYATSRRDWAVVGSGPTRAAADEIRIKLSELCYKSIASDCIEDKKHIDLSAEPLILVCAAGLSLMALKDAVKEVAIFKSHKSLPIVIATEGFEAFEHYAAGVLYVPRASENASVLLNTLVGHLWGYYAARAIDQGAAALRPARALAVRHLASGGQLSFSTLRQMLSIGRAFAEALGRGAYNSSLSVTTAIGLSQAFHYLTGDQPLRQWRLAFQEVAGGLVEAMVVLLTRAIQELSRPIDAIKHQAKTITVGISRAEEPLTGPLFTALRQADIAPDALPYRDLLLVRAISPAVAQVAGLTLYEISGLGPLGETGSRSAMRVVRKLGIAEKMRSRADAGYTLVGTKEWVVRRRQAFVGRGKNDRRPILILPVLPAGQVEFLALLHLQFHEALPLEQKVSVLREMPNRYEDLKGQVEETGVEWRDELLEPIPVSDLVVEPVDELAEAILSRAQVPANPRG